MSIDPTIYQTVQGFKEKPNSLGEKTLDAFKRPEILRPKIQTPGSFGAVYLRFCLPGKKLMIELGGSEHMAPEIMEKDREKEQWARRYGYKVLRFNNSEVQNNIEAVLEVVRREIG